MKFSIRSLFGCACVVAVLITSGCGSDGDDDGGASGDARITLDEYNAIQNGMTFEQVDAILSPAPMVLDVDYTQEIHFLTWEDKPTATIVTVQFTNGIVVGKAKSPYVV